MSGVTGTLASHGWWIASRASGLVALVLVTISVAIGLAMSGRVLRGPGTARALLALHEQTALAGLIAIAVHGLSLLGDPWLRPGLTGVAVPFAMAFEPLWTGLGIVAGYLAVLLGVSFYLRRHLPAGLWRKAHRATVVVYLLAVVHALGAGSDAGSAWLRAWMLASGAAISALFAHRVLASRRSARSRRPPAGTRRAATAPSVQ